MCQNKHLHKKSFYLDLFKCPYDPALQRYSLEKLMFRKIAVLGSFGHILPTSGNPMWPKLPKGTPASCDLSFAPTSIQPSVTKKQAVKAHVSINRCSVGHFGRIRPFSVAEFDQNCQKAHLHAKTFIWVYSNPRSKRPSVTKKQSCFEKSLLLDILAKIDHFRWPNLAKTIKRHIYMPRPFIWAYS